MNRPKKSNRCRISPSTSKRNPPEVPRRRPGLLLEEPPPGAEPAKEGPVQEEFDFETETAAELYLRQGIFREALRIYRKLHEQTGDPNFLARIRQIENQEMGGRENGTIDRLNRFLQLIRKRGNKLV